ncbi:MAG: hypothetical protein M3285_03205 [Actinomycetota bacterium]|nr:hypothetical protein [Actinomycetota bacterium]
MNASWLVVAMGAAAICIGGYVFVLLLRKSRLEAGLNVLREREPRS